MCDICTLHYGTRSLTTAVVSIVKLKRRCSTFTVRRCFSLYVHHYLQCNTFSTEFFNMTWFSLFLFKKIVFIIFYRGWHISVANIIVECKYMYILNIIDFDFIVIFQLLFGVLEFSTVTHDLQL